MRKSYKNNLKGRKISLKDVKSILMSLSESNIIITIYIPYTVLDLLLEIKICIVFYGLLEAYFITNNTKIVIVTKWFLLH